MYVKDVNLPADGVMCISLYMHVLQGIHVHFYNEAGDTIEDRKTEKRERKAIQNNFHQTTIGHSKRVGHSREITMRSNNKNSSRNLQSYAW